MVKRRIRRKHYAFVRVTVQVEVITFSQPMPYWITAGISKVFGAAPATVFEPMPPVASIRRYIETRAMVLERDIPDCRASTVKAKRKPNLGWLKMQAMQNGEGDHIRGYDDGECERSTRGIH